MRDLHVSHTLSRRGTWSWTIRSSRTKKRIVIYYEWMKRELKIRPICECRCDERLNTKVEESTRLTHTGLVVRGTGTPKHKDEVNRREVCECNGWVCVLEVIGAPSRLRLTRKTVDFRFKLWGECLTEEVEESTGILSWTPEVAKKRSVSRWACKNKRLTNSLYNLPDVLAIADIKEMELGGLLL